MMLLLDHGNTRLKWALADGDALGPMQADVLHGELVLPYAPIARVASSCADRARLGMLEARLRAAGIAQLERVDVPRSDALLQLAYSEPAELGVDRWLAMRAARHKTGDACLVASVGTALTVDAITANGQHLGGCIAPGPDAMRAALLAAAPHLRDGGELQTFADSTINAVHSGPLLAAAALIVEQWRRLTEQVEAEPLLVLTGGAAEALACLLPSATRLVPELVLRGMLGVDGYTRVWS